MGMGNRSAILQTWQVKAKLEEEHSWVGEMKICSGYLGHMTNMASIAILRSNPFNISGTMDLS